jgi:hypothetical protein
LSSSYEEIAERQRLAKSGIDMLLNLFDMVYWQNLFPRKMATAASQGKQFEVKSKQEIFTKCVAAHYKDCRLNAYPTRGDRDLELGYLAPSILFIDIDKSGRSEAELAIILEETLAKIKEELEINPLVLWTGNGYHIYIGIKVHPLFNQVQLMNQCEALGTDPNKELLRFAGGYFTEGRSDPERDRGISQKSALLRIPYTLNSKCLEDGRDPVVKVIQKHSDFPAQMTENLLLDFKLHITKMWKDKYVVAQPNLIDNEDGEGEDKDDWDEDSWDEDDGIEEYHGQIKWIETILQTPVSKNRYTYLFHIIGPYLRHTLQLSKNEARQNMLKWLQLCNQKSKVTNVQGKLAGALSGPAKWAPWKLETLRRKNIEAGYEYQELLDAIDKKNLSEEEEEDEDKEEEDWEIEEDE